MRYGQREREFVCDFILLVVGTMVIYSLYDVGYMIGYIIVYLLFLRNLVLKGLSESYPLRKIMKNAGRGKKE